MNKAYSLLEVKALDEGPDFVTIRGMATTPVPDMVRDVIDPMGARFKTPMPLLLNHDHALPVGEVTFAKPQPDGVPFEARMPIIKEPGAVKDRVDAAIHSVRYSLIKGVSVGFKPVAGAIEVLKDGGRRFKEWDWFELSLVALPANQDAQIAYIKSIDQQQTAPASGPAADQATAPGVSGHTKAAPVGPVSLISRRKDVK